MFKSEFGIQVQNGQITNVYSNCNISADDVVWDAYQLHINDVEDGDWHVKIITTTRQTLKIRVTFCRDKRIAYRHYYLVENGTLLLGRDGKNLASHLLTPQNGFLESVYRLGITRIHQAAPESSYSCVWRPEDPESAIDYTVLASDGVITTTIINNNITYYLSDSTWAVSAKMVGNDAITERQVTLIAPAITEELIAELEKYLDNHDLCGFDDLLSTWEELV